MLYDLKRVRFGGEERVVVLQNANGPCPLLAICNVLLLRGKLRIDPLQRQIAFEELSVMLRGELAHAMEAAAARAQAHREAEQHLANLLQNQEDVLRLLPKLEGGLDVNVKFRSAAAFEYTAEIGLFDAFRIRLFHAWVIDPQDVETARALKDLSYNNAMALIVQKEQQALAEDEKLHEVARAQQLSDLDLARVARFLDDARGQITVYGLAEMHQLIHEGELCVFFHNNHFSTVLKRDGKLYTLVTDVGILRAEPRIVWQRLNDVDGDNIFLTADFRLPASDPPLIDRRDERAILAAVEADAAAAAAASSSPPRRRPSPRKREDSCAIL